MEIVRTPGWPADGWTHHCPVPAQGGPLVVRWRGVTGHCWQSPRAAEVGRGVARATAGREEDGVPPDRLRGDAPGAARGTERTVTGTDAGPWTPGALSAATGVRCLCPHGARGWVGRPGRCCGGGRSETARHFQQTRLSGTFRAKPRGFPRRSDSASRLTEARPPFPDSWPGWWILLTINSLSTCMHICTQECKNMHAHTRMLPIGPVSPRTPSNMPQVQRADPRAGRGVCWPLLLAVLLQGSPLPHPPAGEASAWAP